MSDLEKEIKAAGADKAPRITPDHIEAVIVAENYFTAAQGVQGATPVGLRTTVPHPSLKLLTLCVLVLENGFTVTGESACASPENFNVDIGRRIARENAVEKVWLLEGYRLKQKLYASQ